MQLSGGPLSSSNSKLNSPFFDSNIKIQSVNYAHHNGTAFTHSVDLKKGDCERLEEKCKRIDAKLKDAEESHEKRTQILTEGLQKLAKATEEERSEGERVFEEQVKKVTRLEEKMLETVNSLEKRKAESDAAVSKYLHDRLGSVWESVREEASDRNKHIDGLADLHGQIEPDCDKRVRAVAAVREENDKRIMTEINNGFEDVASSLQAERKKRDENDQSSFDIIKEFVENARKEIGQERKEREKNEESFLNLLEDTCAKLQALSVI